MKPIDFTWTVALMILSGTICSSGQDTPILENTPTQEASAQGQVPEESIQWELLCDENGRVKDVGLYDRIAIRLRGMESAQILEQIDIIRSKNMNQRRTEACISAALGTLCRKDPQAVLENFSDGINRYEFCYFMPCKIAFETLLTSDPTAALTWFDAKIADGKFDIKELEVNNPSRLDFERSVMRELSRKDPRTVAHRLAKMSVEVRKPLLQHGQIEQYLKPEDGELMAKILKASSIPEEEVRQIYVDLAENIMTFGPKHEKVDILIGNAKPDAITVRGMLVSGIGSTLGHLLTRQSLSSEDQMKMMSEEQAWAIKYVGKDKIDAVMGEALAEKSGLDGSFPLHTECALTMLQQAKNEQLFVAYLKAAYAQGCHKDQVIELIKEVRTPSLRNELKRTLRK